MEESSVGVSVIFSESMLSLSGAMLWYVGRMGGRKEETEVGLARWFLVGRGSARLNLEEWYVGPSSCCCKLG